MSTGIELMQHALGISERNRTPYRNYFLAGEGHTDNVKWEELVSDGFATSRPAPDFVGGGTLYHVTEKGEATAISALPEPKKRTRYDDYLHSEVCESFGEWLGIELRFTRTVKLVGTNGNTVWFAGREHIGIRIMTFAVIGCRQRKRQRQVTKKHCANRNWRQPNDSTQQTGAA